MEKKIGRSKYHKVNNTKNMCYLIIKGSIQQDTIGDIDYVRRSISRVEDLMEKLPDEDAEQLESFMDEYIYPIAYDPNFFGFIFRKEYGEYDDKGNYTIKSEEAFSKIKTLWHEHILVLNAVVDEFAFKQFLEV